MKVYIAVSLILVVSQLGGLIDGGPLGKGKRSPECNSAKGVARSTNPAKTKVHLLADLDQLAHGIKRDADATEEDCSHGEATKPDEGQSNKEAAISAVPGDKREGVTRKKLPVSIVSEDDSGELTIVPIIQLAKSSVISHTPPNIDQNVTAHNFTANMSVNSNETRTQNGSASTAITKEGENKRTNFHHHKGGKKTVQISGKDKGLKRRPYHSPIVPDAAETASRSDGIMNIGSAPPPITISKDAVSNVKPNLVSNAKSVPVSNIKSIQVSDVKSTPISNAKFVPAFNVNSVKVSDVKSTNSTPVAGSKSSSISNGKSSSASTSSGAAPGGSAGSKTSATAAAKQPVAPDPYAEIADGPDSPKLPELKTGNEMAPSNPPPPMLKMGQSASKSAGGGAPNPPSNERNTPQDVGGILDRLTDRLNTAGGGVAPEQPLPQGESKSIQEQLSHFDEQALQQVKGWESNGVKAIKDMKMGEMGINDLSQPRPMGGDGSEFGGERPTGDLNGEFKPAGGLNGGRSAAADLNGAAGDLNGAAGDLNGAAGDLLGNGRPMADINAGRPLDLNGGKLLGDLNGGKLLGDLNGGKLLGDLNGGKLLGDLNGARPISMDGQVEEDYNSYLNNEATKEERPGGRYSNDYDDNMYGNPGVHGGGNARGDLFDETEASYLGAANAAMGQAAPEDSFERRTIDSPHRFDELDDRREQGPNGYDGRDQYFKRSIILRPIHYYYYKHLPYAFKHPNDD